MRDSTKANIVDKQDAYVKVIAYLHIHSICISKDILPCLDTRSIEVPTPLPTPDPILLIFKIIYRSTFYYSTM